MRRNLFDDLAVLFFRFIGDYFRVRAGEVSNSIQKKQNKIAADLEKGFGVYMADRNTVNLSERMKVTVCLNPVHSATGPLGVVLGYDLFAHMLNTNEDMMKMARMVAYDEGLPVVADTNGAGDSFWCGMRCAFFSGESEFSVIFYIIFVPVSRIFQDSLLCLVVNIDQTKSFGISLGPFEIIHQGPLEITAYIRNSGGLF